MRRAGGQAQAVTPACKIGMRGLKAWTVRAMDAIADFFLKKERAQAEPLA